MNDIINNQEKDHILLEFIKNIKEECHYWNDEGHNGNKKDVIYNLYQLLGQVESYNNF